MMRHAAEIDAPLVRRRRVLAGSSLALLTAQARAQAPAATLPRRITIVTPYGAGSAPDVVARTLSDILSRRLGISTVVMNRLGASGNIGNLSVARAAPDGETLLLAACPLATSVSLFSNLGYDPLVSFEPVFDATELGFVLVVNPAAGRTASEFLERARRTGSMRYASTGVGTAHHLGMELLRRRAAFEAVHVPYRSSGAAIPDLSTGRVDAMIAPVATAVNAARDGTLVVLASAARERLPYAPDIPTFAEVGVPDLVVTDWQGLCAPRGTSPALLDMLNGSLDEAFRSPDIVAHLASFGLTVSGGPRQNLRDRLSRDIPYWAEVIRQAGIDPA